MANDNILDVLGKVNKDLVVLIESLARVRSASGAKRMVKEFVKFKETLNGVVSDLERDKITQAFKKTVKGMEQLENEFTKKSIAASNKRTQTNIKNIKKTRREEDLAFKRRIEKLSSYSTRMVEFFKMQLAWYPAKAFTFKVLAIPGDVIRSTAEYGDALAQVSSVAQLMPAELSKVDAVIKQTAVSTKYSLDEVAQAAKTLAQAGFKGKELTEAIKPIALLSTATASSIQESTDLVSTIIRAYGKSASEIKRITDTLAASVTSSKLTIKDLSEAFSYVASASSQAGVSFETTTAMLAILANRGMKMTTAATGLRMALLKMLAPTKQARKELEKLGMAPDALDPTKHSIQEIIKLLSSIDAESLIKIFSARSASAIMSLTQAGSQAISDMEQAINQQGISAAMASEQLLDLKQSWKNLSDVIKNYYVTVGSSFSDELAIKIRTFKTYILEAANGVGIFGKALKLVINNLGKLLLIYGTFQAGKFMGTGGLFATKKAMQLEKVITRIRKDISGIPKLITKIGMALSTIASAGSLKAMFAKGLSYLNLWYVAAVAIAAVLGGIVYKVFESRRKMEELVTNVTKARLEYKKFTADVAKSHAELKLKVKLSEEDSILGKSYLAKAKSDAIAKLKDLMAALEKTGGAAAKKINPIKLIAQQMEQDKNLTLTKIDNLMQDASDVIANSMDKLYLRTKLLAISRTQLISEDVLRGIQQILASKDIVKGFQEYENKLKALNEGAKAQQNYVGMAEFTPTESKSITFASKDKLLQALKDQGLDVRPMLQSITKEGDDDFKKAQLEIREKLNKLFFDIVKQVKILKDKGKTVYTKEWHNLVVKPFETALEQAKRTLGDKGKGLINEFKEKLKNALSGEILDVDLGSLNQKFEEVKLFLKQKVKDIGNFGAPNVLQSQINSLTVGNFKAAAELHKEINNEISRLSGRDDTQVQIAKLKELRDILDKLFSDTRAKNLDKIYKAKIKNINTDIRTLKVSQDLAKSTGDLTTANQLALDIYDKQIAALKVKINQKLLFLKADDKEIIILRKQIKLLDQQKKLEKLYNPLKITKEKLAALESIAKAQGRYTDATKIHMQTISAEITTLEKHKSILKKDSLEYQKISAQIIKLSKDYEKLFETLKESSTISGFVKRLKEINREYKNIGLTAKDGIELANGLNKSFRDSVITSFSEILDNTRKVKDVFKDTLSSMFDYFKQWVAKILATKIVIPITANIAGALTGGIASAAGGAIAGKGFSGAGLWAGAGALASKYMGKLAAMQQATAAMLPGNAGVSSVGGVNVSGLAANAGMRPSGMAGWVQGLSQEAFMGGISGLGAFVLTGLRTGDWGKAAAQGLGAGGGTWGGATLGTAIMPGIGTLIGGLAGGLLGSFGVSKLLGKKPKKAKEYYNLAASIGIDQNGNFTPGAGFTPTDAGDAFIGKYLRAHGKHTEHEFDQALKEVSADFDKQVGDVLDSWTKWLNDFSSELPEDVNNRFIQAVNDIDFSWSLDKQLTKPDEEGLKKTIEAILTNLNESLWNSFDDAIIPAMDEGFKDAFKKIGVNIDKALMQVGVSQEEFQETSKKLAYRLQTLTNLQDKYDKVIGESEAAARSLTKQFKDLTKQMKASDATSAELAELDRLEQEAKQQFIEQTLASLTPLTNISAIFKQSMDDIAVTYKDYYNAFQEIGATAAQTEKLVTSYFKKIYQNIEDQTSAFLSGMNDAANKYFDPLLNLDKKIKDAGGKDYYFTDLKEKANTQYQMLQWAKENDRKDLIAPFVSQLSDTLTALNEISSNLKYKQELEDLRTTYIEYLGGPKDYQSNMLIQVSNFRTSVNSYLKRIALALENGNSGVSSNQTIHNYINFQGSDEVKEIDIPDIGVSNKEIVQSGWR